MGTVILVVLFCLIYALILFVIAYATDTVDIACDDFKSYEPSIYDLSEEERTSYCAVDYYIKNTICPRYHYQILRDEIKHYQGDGFFEIGLVPFVNIFLLLILMEKFNIGKQWENCLFLICSVPIVIIGFMCYIAVKVLYKKYSSLSIISYYKYHSSYDWESHYNYLLSQKDKVIFRHTLRNTISVLAVLFFIVAAIYNNIN